MKNENNQIIDLDVLAFMIIGMYVFCQYLSISLWQCLGLMLLMFVIKYSWLAMINSSSDYTDTPYEDEWLRKYHQDDY